MARFLKEISGLEGIVNEFWRFLQRFWCFCIKSEELCAEIQNLQVFYFKKWIQKMFFLFKRGVKNFRFLKFNLSFYLHTFENKQMIFSKLFGRKPFKIPLTQNFRKWVVSTLLFLASFIALHFSITFLSIKVLYFCTSSFCFCNKEITSFPYS